MLRSYFRRTAQVVQANPAYLPGNLLVLRDVIIHQERKVPQSDWISRPWDMPVELFPFCRHCGRGHSSWVWGVVYCGLMSSPHLDPWFSNKRRTGCEEGIHCRPQFGGPSAPVLLDSHLDCTAEVPGTPLVLLSERLNPVDDKTPSLRWYPGLTVAFLPRWLGDGPPDIGKHAVYPVGSSGGLMGKRIYLPR